MILTAAHPHALWLLLSLPGLWWIARDRLPRLHIALRCAIVACIVAALAQPGVSWRSGQARRVYVLDQKARSSPAARARGRAILAARLASVPDAAEVTLIQLGGAPVSAKVARRIAIAEPRAASLSVALAEAARAIPFGAGGTVTLISDGLSADRHWGAAVDALVRRGIAVDTAALVTAPGMPFVSALDAAVVRAGETMPVTVTLEGRGDGLRLALYADGRPVASADGLSVDGVQEVAMRFTAPDAGFHRLRAVVTGPGGADAGFDTITAVQPPLRLLYLGGRQAGAAGPLQRLLGRGIAVEARDPSFVRQGTDLDGYHAVMIDDVPATRLPAPAQRHILDAISARGLGLLYTGGEAAFGRGGWDRTPLAGALPLTLRQDERVEKPSVALAVVIDSSGSMGGEPLDLAKQVTVLAARKLGVQDSLGVVEFYGAKQWALPMQPVRDHAAIERVIGHMQAQGSSVLFPAMQEAYYGIKDVDARFKHILVISDGDVSDGSFEQLLRHVAGQGINVSTVVINGDDKGIQRMMQWARWGHGRSYTVADDTGLVQIDFSPPQVKPDPGYRQGATAVRVDAARSWWRGAAIGPPPAVAGHVRVGLRAGTETLLTTGDGDPLLTSWQYGSGRITALMTEPLGQGTQGWAAWPRYGEWLGRTIAATARQSATVAAQIDRTFDRIRVTLRRSDAGRGTPAARLSDGRGRNAPLALREMAPGLFVGDLAWPAASDALLRAADGRETVLAADRAGSDVVTGRLSRLAALPLSDLSRRTGGVPLAAGQRGSVAAGGDVAFSALWPWLALLALSLYILEIVYRRWPVRQVGQGPHPI